MTEKPEVCDGCWLGRGCTRPDTCKCSCDGGRNWEHVKTRG